jgi:hypothetical protein
VHRWLFELYIDFIMPTRPCIDYAYGQTLAATNCYVMGEPFVGMLGGTALFKEDEKGMPLLDLKDNTHERNVLKKCLYVLIEQATMLPKTRAVVID